MSVSFDEFGFFNNTWELNQVNWAKMFSPLVSDGVMAGIGGELQVYADSAGMTVHIRPGECRVRGHRGSLETNANLNIATADSVNPRIDLVVARVTYGNPSSMVLDVLTGTPAEEPTVPEVTQTAGDVWEIPLAAVKVPANSTTVAAGDVSDYRYVYSGGGVGAVKLKNGESDDLQKGELVIMAEGEANTVMRCGLNDVPIGVVETNTISAGASGTIQTVSGAQVEIKCDTGAVQVGDTLIPSTTAGQAKRGGGYGAGFALEAKAAGAVGNVKSILAVMSPLRNPNRWYLVDGIDESNVVAAYKFKGAATVQEALTNVNEGTAYALTRTGSVVLATGKGLLFPASTDCYINNEGLIAQASNITTCVFQYSDLSVAGVAVTAGACIFSNCKALFARYCTNRRASESIYEWSYHTLLRNASSYPALRTAKAYESGCLAADWNYNKMWHDGIQQSLTTGDYTNVSGWGLGRVFTTCSFTHKSVTASPMYVTALVFYNCSLTDAQHVQLANQINAL